MQKLKKLALIKISHNAKKALEICGLGALLTAVLPFVIVKGWSASYVKWEEKVGVYAMNQFETADDTDHVSVYDDGEVIYLSMFDYVCGVVAAEMPASYHEEALKAQAVASYSYTLYHINTLKDNPDTESVHHGAAVCTDPSHCKAYISKAEAKEKWGETAFEKYWTKIESAVKAVYKKAACFDGEPINATFFAISAGKTENAADVWGSDVPYLKSVDSAFDKSYPEYSSTSAVSKEDFKEKVLTLDKEASFGDDANSWIGEITRSEAGGVLSVTIGGKSFTGSQIRSLFSLRSANFEVAFKDNSFTFSVKGYGHDVGMSQTGAEYLADEGKTYEEILKWYYTGIEITDTNPN